MRQLNPQRIPGARRCAEIAIAKPVGTYQVEPPRIKLYIAPGRQSRNLTLRNHSWTVYGADATTRGSISNEPRKPLARSP